MANHSFEILLKLLNKSRVIEDDGEVLEVLVEGLGDCFTKIDASNCFLINLLYLL